MNSVECGICYDELSLNKNTCTTSCGHQFCMGCFIKCTQQSNKCPLCRVELYEEEEYDEDDDEEFVDEDEEDGNTSGDEHSEMDDESGKLTIEDIEERLLKEGYNMKHILCMLFDDIRSSNADFNKTNRNKFYQDIDNLANDMINESEESEMMEAEDINILAEERPKVGTLENPNILVPRRITRTESVSIARNLAEEFDAC